MRRIVAGMIVVAVAACAPAPDDAPEAPAAEEQALPEAGTPDTPATAPAAESTSPSDPDGSSRVAAIPARFHGEWNADRDACGRATETRLRISADRIRFYESSGVVRAVDVESDRAITVTAEYTGEGETWEDRRRLSLSADGNELTVSNGTSLVRRRCP